METYSGTSGSKTYICEATYSLPSPGGVQNKWVTIWVKGTFSWDNENNQANVTNCTKGYTPLLGLYKVKEDTIKTEDNKGGFWGGNCYAYIEYDVVMSNGGNTYKTFTLKFDVDVNGDYHIKTSPAADGTEVG